MEGPRPSTSPQAKLDLPGTAPGTAGCLDLVLLNTPYFDYEIFPHEPYPSLPPIGLGYLATYLHSQGFGVALLDAEHYGLTPAEISEVVNSLAPRFLGVNLLTPTYGLTRSLLREIDPRIRIVVGGPHVDAMDLKAFRDLGRGQPFYAVLGNGEFKLAALLEGVEDRGRIPGVATYSEGRFTTVPDAPNDNHWNPRDLDALPFLNRSFLPTDPFYSEDRIEANVLASRGCPFHCTFCAGASSSVRSVRRRSAENLLAEIEELRESSGVSAIRFVDDLFFPSSSLLAEFSRLRRVSAGAAGFAWQSTARVDLVNKGGETLATALAVSGCRQLSLGIESGSPRIQAYIHKGVLPDDARRVVRLLSRAGIRASAYFVVGFPGESEAEIRSTFELFRELRTLSARIMGRPSRSRFRANIFQFLPFPGTIEWQRLLAAGYHEEELLTSFEPVLLSRLEDQRMRRRWATSLQFSELTPESLLRLIEDALLEQESELTQSDALPAFAWGKGRDGSSSMA